MSVPLRFQDKEYRNWVKCSLSLVLVKEGLHDYVDTEVKKLHVDIEQKVTSAIGGPSVGQICGFCKWKDVRKAGSNPITWYIKCKSSVCDKWLSEILAVHTDPHNASINWRNADISQWPTHPYEIAKVYMPKGQDKTCHLPQELDAPAVLSLLKYCTWFSSSIPNIHLLSDLIDVRNTVLHSGELKISNSDKDLWIDKMIQLLSDLNISSSTQSELSKVKCEDIDMNFREIEIRALQNLVSSVKSAIAEVKGEITSLQNFQTQHSEERDKDMEERDKDMEQMKKLLNELKTISDKMVSFIDKNQDVDKEIIGNLRKIENDVHDLQNKFCKLEERVSSLENQFGKHKEKTKNLEKYHQESNMVLKEVERRLTTVEKRSEKGDELDHQKEIYHLRDDLKSRYKSLSTIPISPFDEEETTALQDLYVDVIIEHQTEEKNTLNNNMRSRDNSKDRKSEMLSSYKQIFLDKRNERIILTGLSGSGKSMFCRNIVHTWSTEDPNKQNEYTQEKDLSVPDSQRVMADKKETGHTCIVEELDVYDPQSSEAIADQDILLQFTLLFYICAPKIAIEKTLTEVLCNQCIKIESDHLSKFFKEQPEKVLIILDGIDEMGGEIPSFLSDLLERKLHPRIIVLMVMRPWKISQLKLRPSSHYDLLLEVQGMSQKKALKFVQKVINVCKKHMTVKRLDPSSEEQKVMSSFKKTPLLLLFLARIWCQDPSLPTRQQDLYRKILECIIERCLNKTGSKYISAFKAQDTMNIKIETFWKTYVESACQIAHHFLLHGASGSSVVMPEMDLMNQLGDKAQLKLSALLDCGILSKLDAFSSLREKNVSIAFLHLSVQEYLTSIRLVSNENAFQNFLKSLKTLNDVLRYENLFIFICGLDAKKGHTAFKRIYEVCDDDPHVRQYRQGRDGRFQILSSLDNLNKMYRACLNEMDNQELVHMPDIYVCVPDLEWYNIVIPRLEPYFVKSLTLDCNRIRYVIFDFCSPTNLISLCSSIKSCIHLESLDLEDITLHDGVLDLSSLAKLTSLRLWHVTMSGECIRSLCSSIKSCIHLESLDLYVITLHDGVLDLSSLAKLTSLRLWHVTMSGECSRSLCSSIMSFIHLESLDLSNITLHDGVLDLSSLAKLTSLRLWHVTMSGECSRSLCSSIMSFIHLESLDLSNITLHDGVLDLSSLAKLTSLRLWHVTMSGEYSRSLCSSIMSFIHLESLDLSNITLHDGVLDLSSLAKLTSLRLWHVTMSGECSRSLCSSIMSFIHLESLDLSNITLHDGVLDLSSLAKLTSLRLWDVTMSGECSRSLCSSIMSFIHLESLDLSNITLHDGVLDLSSLAKLTSLRLWDVTMSGEYSRSLCSSIMSFIHLESLDLSNITLHDGVLDLSSLAKLTFLKLNDVTMSGECSRSLCSSIMSFIHLESLDLSNITLHDGVLDLSSLAKLTSLRLWDVTMSGEYSRSLCSSIMSFIHLESLDLSNITLHDGVLDLSSLAKLTSLRLWHVTMSGECSRSLSSSIKSCIHLKSVQLLGITLHDEVLDLSSLSNLRVLIFKNVTMSSLCTQTLETSLKRCQKLITKCIN